MAQTKIKGSKAGNGANSNRKERKYDRRKPWRKIGMPAKAGKRAKGSRAQVVRLHQRQSVYWWHKNGPVTNRDWGGTDRESGRWVGGKCWCGKQHVIATTDLHAPTVARAA